MKKNTIEKVKGTVENIIPIELDVYAGFTSTESIAAIKNASMRKQVTKFAKAVKDEINSKWEQAIAVAGMTVEMRKEFGNDAAVANFLGMTRGQFSKLQRAGKFAIEYKKTHDQLPSYTVFTEVLPLESEKYGKQDLTLAVEYITDNELTQAEVREYVKSYKKPSEKNEEAHEESCVETDSTESDSSTKLEEEQEERWIDLVQITEEELSKISTEDAAALSRALHTVLKTHGIDVDNVWIKF